jgi:hypothetical protein
MSSDILHPISINGKLYLQLTPSQLHDISYSLDRVNKLRDYATSNNIKNGKSRSFRSSHPRLSIGPIISK